MMITYRSRFLTRAEVWFDNEPGDTRSVDWVLYQQRSGPVPGAQCRFFYTYVVDLTQSHEQLLANLHKDNAYKIRRARDRDKIVCEVCDPRDRAVMDRFEEMNNTFATLKGLAPLDRPRIESMAAADVLDLTAARDAQCNVLVYHANYRDRRRARALHLPSLYRKLSTSGERNFIGRANRLLTWSNILRYQEAGLQSFDFGGWYPGGADPARLDINRFKEGFGGKVVREYQCEQILTLKGWLVLRAAGLLQRAKSLRGRQVKPLAAAPGEPVSGATTAPAH